MIHVLQFPYNGEPPRVSHIETSYQDSPLHRLTCEKNTAETPGRDRNHLQQRPLCPQPRRHPGNRRGQIHPRHRRPRQQPADAHPARPENQVQTPNQRRLNPVLRHAAHRADRAVPGRRRRAHQRPLGRRRHRHRAMDGRISQKGHKVLRRVEGQRGALGVLRRGYVFQEGQGV